MIRYLPVPDADLSTIDGPRSKEITALGFRRDGAYMGVGDDGKECIVGEIFVDPTASTILNVYRMQEPLGKGSIVALTAQSVLQDGTFVSTEQRPKKHWWLFRAGITLPVPGSSTRFPATAGAAELAESHAGHVDELVRARGGNMPRRTGLTTAAYIEARHAHQARRAPSDEARQRVGRWVAAPVLLLGLAATVWAAIVGPTWIAELTFVAAIASPVAALVAGTTHVAPWLMRRGIVKPRAAPPAAQERKAAGAALEIALPARGSAFAAIWFLAVFGVALAALLRAPNSVPLAVAYVAGIAGDVFAKRRRSVRRKRTTLEVGVDRGMLRLEGRAPIPLSDVGAVLSVASVPPVLTVLDTKGRILLEARGPAERLAALSDAIGVRRPSLPLETRALRMAGALMWLPAIALFMATKNPASVTPLAFTAAAMLLAARPMAALANGPRLEVGVDGLVVVSMFGRRRFIAFAELDAVEALGDSVVTKKDGVARKYLLERKGSAGVVAGAWRAHVSRGVASDPHESARRRVATLEVEPEAVPYRVRVEDPEALAEAALDSSESRSVRVRAARKLAASVGDGAARAREDAAERIVDPEVRRELAGSGIVEK